MRTLSGPTVCCFAPSMTVIMKRVVPVPAPDLAHALVLSLGAGDDHPVVAGALEIQVASLELELRVAGRRVSPLLILRDEPEVGLAGMVGVRVIVRGVGPRGRPEPAAAGDVP